MDKAIKPRVSLNPSTITLAELERLDRLYLPPEYSEVCTLPILDMSKYRPQWLQDLWEKTA